LSSDYDLNLSFTSNDLSILNICYTDDNVYYDTLNNGMYECDLEAHCSLHVNSKDSESYYKNVKLNNNTNDEVNDSVNANEAGFTTEYKKVPKKCSHGKVKIIYLNARSLKTVNSNINKLVDFQNLVYLSECDVVSVGETWLNNSVLNSEILDLNNYVIYRRDRENQRGGGVLVAVKKEIQSSYISNSNTHEILLVEIRPTRNSKMLIVSCYRSPSTNICEFVSTLRSILLENIKKYSSVCVTGDFNLPGIKWCNNYGSSVNFEENLFLDLCSEFSLNQLNTNSSTCHGNILDLVLTTTPDVFSDICSSSLCFESDHFPLEFNMKITIKRNRGKSREMLNFKKANFSQINSELCKIDLVGMIESSDSVDTACQLLFDKLNVIIKQNVPTVSIKKHADPPWFDKSIRHLRNCKNSAWRNYKRHNSKSSRSKFKGYRNKLNSKLKHKYNMYVNDLGRNIKENPKSFWKFVKIKTGKGTIPECIKNDNVLLTSAVEKAEAFNEYFYSMFTTPDIVHSNEYHVTDNNNKIPQLCELNISEFDVLKVIKNLDCSKASGHDNIPPVLLRECCNVLSRPLCVLFNMCLSTGSIPRTWCCANIMPIYKSGDAESIKSYRPISLLPIVSKVLERCVYNKIYPHICNKLNISQHGFVTGRSTSTQLLNWTDFTSRILDSQGQVDVIYLDFEKAFDKVSHDLLLTKLRLFGFGGSLIDWFEAYLTKRKQRVVIDGKNSKWLPVLSGVPQGSILGPLLFLLFINDIPSYLKYSKIMMYADDAKIYLPVNDIQDCDKLQKDLNYIIQWSEMWKMKLNVAKCKIISVVHKINNLAYDYNINGITLERCKHIKDLGIIINDKLSWSMHVQSLVCKANRVMGLIKRTMGYNAAPDVNKQLYISLVRSLLEYGTPVWGGMTVHDTVLIERIQRSATRYILSFPNLDYRERLMQLNIIPLTYRREYLDLCLFFKYYNGMLFNLNINDYIELRPCSSGIKTRNTVDNKLYIPKTNTVFYQQMYFNRMIFLWNSLSKELRDIRNFKMFKHKLYMLFFNLVEKCFVPDNVCKWHLNCRCSKCRQI
jgi:hypothetical protein